MSKRRGFTLLEMIVATVILSVAIVGLLSGVSGAMRNAARLTAYDRAVQLARLRMNDLLVDRRLPRDRVIGGTFDPQQSGGIEIQWQARLANFEMPPSPTPGEVALDRLILEVSWMSGPGRRTFTLDALRQRILAPEDITPGAAK